MSAEGPAIDISAPYKVMIVMPWGRVGSNLVVSYIRHLFSVVRLASEPFNHIKGPRKQLAWLQDFYQNPFFADKNNPLRAFPEIACSKQSMLSMPDSTPIEAYVRAEDIRTIRMFREDHVRSAISQIRAEVFAQQSLEETGRATWAVKTDAKPLGPTHIDIEKLANNLAIMKTQSQRLHASFRGTQHLDLEYDDIAANVSAAFARICEFLELPFEDFKPPFRKATPHAYPEIVQNWDEVKQFLSQHQIDAPEAA